MNFDEIEVQMDDHSISPIRKAYSEIVMSNNERVDIQLNKTAETSIGQQNQQKKTLIHELQNEGYNIGLVCHHIQKNRLNIFDKNINQQLQVLKQIPPQIIAQDQVIQFESIDSSEDHNIPQEIRIDIDQLCEICLTNQKASANLECGHQFCRYLNTLLDSPCYHDYLKDKISTGQIQKITCPYKDCEQVISDEIIQKIVTADKFNQYQYFLQRLFVENNPNLKWCPKPGCDCFVEKGPKNIVSCFCGQEVCFLCGNQAHGTLPCSEAMERDFQNAISQYKIKYCPKCKSKIEKSSGCNHMTCSQCKYQFCWVCLQKYYEYHYRYWSLAGCAFWSDGRFKDPNLIDDPDQRRFIFFLPRLFLYLFRGPWLIIKLLLKSIKKAFKIPIASCHKGARKIVRRKFQFFSMQVLVCCLYHIPITDADGPYIKRSLFSIYIYFLFISI
ncbi:hypothetical protein pb186bvf_011714 [Paramecium bursaria]